MIHDGAAFLAESDPVDIPPHTLGMYDGGDNVTETPYAEWVCSCNGWAIRWEQSDPEWSDYPILDDVFTAHARHVVRANVDAVTAQWDKIGIPREHGINMTIIAILEGWN